jgi:glycosyltransferase involved in cell wall biosynthesis
VRILFTSDVYAPKVGGGTEIVVQKLAEALAVRGNTVLVATLDTDHRLPRRELLNGVEVRRFPGFDLTPMVQFQVSVAPGWAWWIYLLAREFRPDVVNAQNLLFVTSFPTMLAARCLSIPAVLTLQVHSLCNVGGLLPRVANIYTQTIGRAALRVASSLVCVGPAVADYFGMLGGPRAREKTRVIWNGVDLEQFTPPARPRPSNVVLSVGRLTANKGPDMFLEAARQILSRRTDVEFWIVGDGPLQQSLCERAAGLPQIRFLGQRSDVSHLMKQASMFVRLSTSEGLSLAILEAMASGLPVIASNIPGNRDLVEEGTTGCLVDSANPEQTAAAIEHLIEHPDVRRAYGAAGRAKVSRSTSWDAATRGMEDLFVALAHPENG